MGKTRKNTTAQAVDTRPAGRLPPQADGVTVNGKPVTERQWLGMNTVVVHEELLERAPSYLIGCHSMLLGQLARYDEAELEQSLRAGMEFKNLPPSEKRVKECMAAIVRACRHYDLPGVGLTLEGWNPAMNDAA